MVFSLTCFVLLLFTLGAWAGQVDIALHGTVSQSSQYSANFPPENAIDGNPSTFTHTQNQPDSFWQVVLDDAYPLTRIQLVNRSGCCPERLGGLVLRAFDAADQSVYSTVIVNPGDGGTFTANLPPGLEIRRIRVGGENGLPNDDGNHYVTLAEVQLFTEDSIPFGPIDLAHRATVWQTTDHVSSNYPAANAIDGDPATFSHTRDLPESAWGLTLNAPSDIGRVELVNRDSCCAARLGGLTLRVLDANSNLVHSAVVANPGLGGTWIHELPPGVRGTHLWIGLPPGETNDDGNGVVTLAEVRLFAGRNLAAGRPSYMVELHDNLDPPGLGNDDDFATEVELYRRTVDGYWEVDLQTNAAIYGVRTYAADCCTTKLSRARVRLFDENHQSVFDQDLAGSGVFDTDTDGPVCARYVRVGLENKQRTAGGTEWHIGVRELQVFGRPVEEVGIAAFTASANAVPPGQPVTLSWQVEDVWSVALHPGIGSVDHLTSNGAGQITVFPNASTTYTLVASNACGTFERHAFVDVDGPLPLRINEFVAANRLSLRDGYNNAEDWIELHNPNPQPVSLLGHGLSDRPNQPMKSVLPDVAIPGFGYVVVFASGRDNPHDPSGDGSLHVDWNLDADGESIQLTAPDGATVLDAVTNVPPQREDLAFGRDLDGDLRFLEPTPGRANAAASYEGWLEPLGFSHVRGLYDAAFTLALTNLNTNAQVLVSLDGGVPDAPPPQPFLIDQTTTVRARVRRPGYKSPPVQTHTYIFLDDVITHPNMDAGITQDPQYAARVRQGLLDLPVVSVSQPGAPNRDESEGSVEFIPAGGAAGSIQANCGILRYGGSYTSFAKKNYRVRFRGEYGTPKLRAPLFAGFDRGFPAVDEFDSLDLRAGSHDMVKRGFYMSNRFADDSMLDMGSLNPHGRFVHLFINGEYWGQYHLRERLIDHFLADTLGGNEDDYVDVRGNDNIGRTFVPGTAHPRHRESWIRMRGLRGDYDAVKAYLDVPHLIDFTVLWMYGNSESEYRAAGPVEAGSGFKFWMVDADGFLRSGGDRTGNAGPGGLFGALVAEGHVDFMTLLADRIFMHLFHDGALTPDRNLDRLCERMAEIEDSLVAECARWGYRTPANWEATADNIKDNLFPQRTGDLFNQLRNRGLYPDFDPPTYAQRGGLVPDGYQPTLSTTTTGIIYVTTDGSDPRLPGGAVSPNAVAWQPGAVTIAADQTVQARVWLNGEWSAINPVRFLLLGREPAAASNLSVTEIHYNPDGDDEYEFVEIHNIGSNIVDLSGVTLSNAVRFSFADHFSLEPGEFAVVVENTDAFVRRYQDPNSAWFFPGIRVAGQWSGALNNGGETLALVASNRTSIATVPYRSDRDWPERANGDGSSLELDPEVDLPAAQPERDAALARSDTWDSSCLYHGSPGRVATCEVSVVINEVLSHTDLDIDWIELRNLSAAPVDLSGWYIGDDIDAPLRFQIPNGTVLAPGAFVSFDAAQLGFGFSELGSDAALVTAVGTNLMRFVDTVDFPAVVREEPFGRYRRSDGKTDFTELRATTRDTTNALPRVGPVVISEIMYHPATSGVGSVDIEFVELVNITAQPVPLFDPAYPTNTWELSGAVAFSFPTGVVLDACSPLIVCATNPAAFRAAHAVPSAVPVFGPWSGALNNAGETLRLRRPGDPEPDGAVPRPRVDRVAYRPEAPWPVAADGDGSSLERRPLDAYGNDPASWFASVPGGTPGALATNRPPAIHVAGTNTQNELEAFALAVRGVDIDAPWQAVRVVATNLPPGATFDATTGVFAWTPTEAQGPGTAVVAFVAFDDGCPVGVATQDIALTVREVNRPPVLTSVANFTHPSELPLQLALQAADPDLPTQRLTFAAFGLPPGLDIAPDTGLLSGTPIGNGPFPVEIRVRDDGAFPLEVTNTFVLTLSEPFVIGAGPPGGNPFVVPTIPGERYELEVSDSIDAPDWRLLDVADPAGTNLWEWATGPTNAPVRFFRVRWRTEP